MLNRDGETAHAVAEAMGTVFAGLGIAYHLHVGRIAPEGARVVAE
ncbi:MAG: hypothetical protein WKG07_29595 [Hymenobacter sp.]